MKNVGIRNIYKMRRKTLILLYLRKLVLYETFTNIKLN